MRTMLSRLMVAGALVPALAQAQSTTPTPATIRLYEQPSGNVLGAEKRVYTSYFNTLRTRYIGVEVTLEYPAAAESSRLSVGCQMTRPDGRAIDGIWKLGMTILAGSTSAVGANVMFGAGRDGWQTGIHKVTCAGAGPLGEVSFQMSPGPSLLADLELRLKEVRFFPTGPRINPIGQRSYQDQFSASEATRIGIELSFLHPGLTKGGAVPIDCYVLAGIGRILGVMNAVYEFEPASTSGSVAVGLGWDQPGQWARGDYLTVCQMHGRPIAVERFSVR
jgi:hypothetical protein